MKFYVPAMLLSFLSLSCSQIKTKPITEVSQKDIKNVLLVDVRTPEEFAAGHLDHAVNMNWYDPDFMYQFNAVDKQRTIYVYCKKGGRSAKAAEVLDSLGFKVVDLTGGYEAIKKRNRQRSSPD
jgi:rhodanese-related sulfurtransferase